LSERYRKLRANPAPLSLERGGGADGTEPLALADPHGQDAEEQMLDLLEQQELAEAIWRYWRATCSATDLLIMRRYEHDPPTPFRTIAKQLGPGWTAEAVRMRHHRIVKRTRANLQDREQRDTEP